jgi:ribosome-associated toxin RatA of RatAB toxin-antitoxin module
VGRRAALTVSRFAAALVLAVVLGPSGAGAEVRARVDHATVSVEKRSGRDWCVLDSQIVLEVPVTVEALLEVIGDYPSYPSLFPDIKEVRVETVPGATLLSERVVVSALGVDNINRFTLRIGLPLTETSTRTTKVEWTQERTDGTIDSLVGGWTFEDRGSSQAPLTRITYRNHSAVPVVVLGQDVVVRMFLGERMRNTVEAVAKRALSR